MRDIHIFTVKFLPKVSLRYIGGLLVICYTLTTKILEKFYESYDENGELGNILNK